ncbi:MAG: hypothetical protein AVDCRST_MAG88-2523, partial [uncultured Thermomicrobiales bacterium]
DSAGAATWPGGSGLRRRDPQPHLFPAVARTTPLQLRGHTALHRDRRPRLPPHRAGAGGGRCGGGRDRAGAPARPRRRRDHRSLQPQGRPHRGRPGPRRARPLARLAAGRLARLPGRGRAGGGQYFLQPDGAGNHPGSDDRGAAAGGQLGRLVDRAAGPDRRLGRRGWGHCPPGDRPGLRAQCGVVRGLGAARRPPADPIARGRGRCRREARAARLPRRRPGRVSIRAPGPLRLPPPPRAGTGLLRGRGDRRAAGRPRRAAPAAGAGRLRPPHRGDRRRRPPRPADPQHARRRLSRRALALRAVHHPRPRRHPHRPLHPAPDRAADPLRLRPEHLHRHGRLQLDGAGGRAGRRAGSRLHPARRDLERDAPPLAGPGWSAHGHGWYPSPFLGRGRPPRARRNPGASPARAARLPTAARFV